MVFLQVLCRVEDWVSCPVCPVAVQMAHRPVDQGPRVWRGSVWGLADIPCCVATALPRGCPGPCNALQMGLVLILPFRKGVTSHPWAHSRASCVTCPGRWKPR